MISCKGVFNCKKYSYILTSTIIFIGCVMTFIRVPAQTDGANNIHSVTKPVKQATNVVTTKNPVISSGSWLQHIQYKMMIDLNVDSNLLKGTQQIRYRNNSPDTLYTLYFHLFWNAFQPNSSMDVRNRELVKQALRKNLRGETIKEWDSRIADRISKLKENETGWQQVKRVTVNGRVQLLREYETILQIVLDKPILPKSTATIGVEFEARVPLLVRRSGRDNQESVRFSMAQWYPKLAEYDHQGWNANFYIGREFYGVWGDFDVTIQIDKNYMVAATGVLQNANQVGFGFESPGVKVPDPVSGKRVWRFLANHVHDFVWAADHQYRHISLPIRKGLTLHAFYKSGNATTDSAWQNVLWAAGKVLPYLESRFGTYPYPQYSFIQGGDGGMEYAMACLIKGSDIGTVFHEWMHSWYQMLLGTNESLYAWMDEGFTQFASDEISAYYYNYWADQSPFLNAAGKQQASFMQQIYKQLPLNHGFAYQIYFNLVKSGVEEPLSTHADHFNTSYAYSAGSYSKGSVFLSQLGYIVGDRVRDRILMEYYRQWKYKHPTPNDFIRVAEKISGIQLQWYKEYWIYGIKNIDYSIDSILEKEGKTQINARRIGAMPMPVDIVVTYKDSTRELYHIPLDLMLGEKADEELLQQRFVQKEWQWTHPLYSLILNRKKEEIFSVELDPTFRLADVDRKNNKWESESN